MSRKKETKKYAKRIDNIQHLLSSNDPFNLNDLSKAINVLKSSYPCDKSQSEEKHQANDTASGGCEDGDEDLPKRKSLVKTIKPDELKDEFDKDLMSFEEDLQCRRKTLESAHYDPNAPKKRMVKWTPKGKRQLQVTVTYLKPRGDSPLTCF